MIKSFKILMPLLIETEDSKKIVLLNFEDGKSYFVNFEETDADFNLNIIEEFLKQQKRNAPVIPDELLDVMNTEKDLTKDSAKHIFRRN
jgi:hypothetical protein